MSKKFASKKPPASTHRAGTSQPIHSSSTAVVLQAGRDKPVRQGHPWIFSGAIQSLPAAMLDGEIVDVVAADGEWLAQGYLNRQSQIQVRILSWQKGETIDTSFWRKKLQQAIERRAGWSKVATAYRLINGENDFLPGLVVDRYADVLVLQAGTLGIDQRKHGLAELLLGLTGCRCVVERSEMALRRQEGLEMAAGVLAGALSQPAVEVVEHGKRFLVELTDGQKTGFYSDQRSNRQRVTAYCAGKRVLNAFSYTGAFAVHALAAGASHVTNIDTSADALAQAETHLRMNGFDPAQVSTQIVGDVFDVLRQWRDSGQQPFDLIILDPPKFVQHKGQLDRALRGYKDINLLAMKLLTANGILATFSCSGLVSADLFQKVVFGAAVDAKRPVQILEWLRQDSDHPVAITFPEGEYLKGLLCRVT
ncbi:MAG: class I SAM-dependent rRNA methyltransferase [Caldilineaceae bacterium]